VQRYRILLSSWLFTFLAAWPASAQMQPEPGGSLAAVIASANLSQQEFHCHTGYSLAECRRELSRLKTVIARYPTSALGHWTWVLVRSEDWKPLLRQLRLNPESPAFSALEQRETFLEEGLFGQEAMRSSELMLDWQLPLDQLLNLAVTHELGHALCNEADEAVADRFGEELRRGHKPRCRISRAPESNESNSEHDSVIARY